MTAVAAPSLSCPSGPNGAKRIWRLNRSWCKTNHFPGHRNRTRQTNISRLKCLCGFPCCGIPYIPCGFSVVPDAGITAERSRRDLRSEISHSQLYCTDESATLNSAAMSSASSATLALQKGLPAHEDSERFILGSVLL